MSDKFCPFMGTECICNCMLFDTNVKQCNMISLANAICSVSGSVDNMSDILSKRLNNINNSLSEY